MTNNVINFSDLGRTEVRCIIYTDEVGVAKAEYAQDKITLLRKTLTNPIIVYNTDIKTQIKLQAIVGVAGNGVYKEKKNIVITAKELILDYLPLVTNIVLNLDAEIDKEEIQRIINDPNKEFEIVIAEVSKIVSESGKTYADNITAFSKLSKEERERILEESKVNVLETEEEKELRELEERSKLLKDKIKQNKRDIVENIEVEEILKTEE